MAEFAANNRASETSKCTPFFAIYGTNPQMTFLNEPIEEWDHQCVDADQVQATMQEVNQHLQIEMRRSQAMQEKVANQSWVRVLNIQKGSRVWMDAWPICLARPTWKLDSKWFGPYMVVRQISPDAYESHLPVAIQIHHVQLVLLLDPMVYEPLVGQWVNPPTPVKVDGEEEYRFSTVQDSQMYWNQLQYLIHWTGYKSLTWDSAKFVDGLQAVGEFHQRYSGKPEPLGDVVGEPQT